MNADTSFREFTTLEASVEAMHPAYPHSDVQRYFLVHPHPYHEH